MSKTSKKTVKEPTLAQQAADQTRAAFAQAGDQLEGTAAEIWAEIKDKEILMFALPDQRVHQHALPVKIEPSKLYLRTTSPAVLPSLETAIGKKFNVELVDKFVIVTRIPPSLTK
jgi:hypothetical protein